MKQSLMQHSFSDLPRADIERSSFNRTHGYKTTFESGLLIPIYVDEALPGDTFVLEATMFGRLATPLTPVMDNLYMDSFWFAVPYRLVWDNWHKFCGAQDNPGDSTSFTIPTMPAPAGGFLVGSLSDYFGIPTEIQNISISSLWHRAYNLIWNEWFRAEDLQNSVVVDKDNGPDADTDYILLRRGKRHDYFTSCLPWPQKGDAISLPLTGDAPITGLGSASQTYPNTNTTQYETDATGTNVYAKSFSTISGTYGLNVEEDPGNTGFPNIRADLSQATATTINDLREAFALQKLAEKDARGGTRYTEIVRSHFGVTSPDSRLQRPEFLGGKTTAINITQVPQTSQTATTPQGTMTGYGTLHNMKDGFIKSFTEHSLLIGLVSVRADLTYQQGIPRMFSRSTKYDFYWPSLAFLGEQAVLNKEIYAQGSTVDTDADGIPDDEEVFGYQERWAEYRYYPSKITGQLRSTYATSLDIWHLSQEFTSLPTLSDTFIQDNPPVDRVLAVATEPHIIYDSFLEIKCVRPMPVYSIPGMTNRF